jgi:predicted site-specific integrase-resolvase
MKQESSPLMTIKETRRVFGDDKVSYTTVWKWVRDGDLPSVRIGKRRFVLREPFMAMLKPSKGGRAA